MGSGGSGGPGTTYAGVYVRAVQGERIHITCRVRSDHGGRSELVLASGPRVLLDWDTTVEKAHAAAVVLQHWLGRPTGRAELHAFLDRLAAVWIVGQPWELTDDQLRAAGFEP